MQKEPTDHQDLFDRIRSQRGVATFLSVAALSVGGVGLAACGEDEPVEDVAIEEPVTEAEEPDFENTSLPRLLEVPEDWVGRTVEVAGAVSDADVDGEPGTAAAFTIGEVLEEDILVLPEADVSPEDLTDESIVTVEGMVVQVVPDLTEQHDFLFEEEGMDDAFLDEHDGEYAIVASQVDVSNDVPIEDLNE